MTKLARTCVHAHKGGQSWYLAMPKDGLAPRVAIYAISTRHPAYLDPLLNAPSGTSRSQRVDNEVGENACPGCSQGRSELVCYHV